MTKSETKKGGKSEEKTATTVVKDSKHSAPSATNLSFEVKPLHTKALLKLLHCHHNGQTLTYSELSDEIGTGEKTKAWQCEAWKDLKSNSYIIPGPSDGKNKKTTYKLSQQGVELAMTFASDEELADFKTPATNEEHHEKIRSKLMRNGQKKGQKHGPKIFDLLLEDPDTPVTRLELASKLKTNPDSHGFFYGFQALQKMGLVSTVGKTSKMKESSKGKETEGSNEGAEEKLKKVRIRGGKQEFKLTEKAFLATALKKEAEE